MDNMSNGISLQKQIASIMDVLAKAAVAEISKVVDDGVVTMRLEICERENQIDSLKRNLQIMSNELRATRRALVRECVTGQRQQLGICQGKENDRPGIESDSANETLDGSREESNSESSRAVIKCEKVDEEKMLHNTGLHKRLELSMHANSTDQEQLSHLWSSENNVDTQNCDYFQSRHDQSQQQLPDPSVSMGSSYDPIRDPLEKRSNGGEENCLDGINSEMPRPRNITGPEQSQLHSHTHNTLAHQPPDGQSNFNTVSLMVAADKRRFACVFCGKSFDRLSHLERHRRIHTGEKPFSCRVCDRRFTQKSSLKSHLTTHRGFSSEVVAAPRLPAENNHFTEKWNMATHCEEQDTHHAYGGSAQDTHTVSQNSRMSYLDNKNVILSKEGLEQVGQQQKSATNNSSVCGLGRNDVDSVAHVNGLKTEEQLEEDRNHTFKETLPDFRLDQPGDQNFKPQRFVNEGHTVQSQLPMNAVTLRKDSTAQTTYQAETTSTVIHSWESPTIASDNQIRVKQEEEESVNLLFGEQNMALPIEHCYADSSRTVEPLPVQHMPYNPLPQRHCIWNRAQKRRERRFLCVLCGKNFDRLSHLDRHQRIHTGEKPFSCVVCGRRFSQKSSLKGHMRTHMGDRAWRCSLCGMTFPTRVSRYRHKCEQAIAAGGLR